MPFCSGTIADTLESQNGVIIDLMIASFVVGIYAEFVRANTVCRNDIY